MQKVTIKLVFSKQNTDRLESTLGLVTDGVLSNYLCGIKQQSKGAMVEATLDAETSLPLKTIFADMQRIGLSSDGLVLTTLSTPKNNVVTFTDKSLFKPKALELAS